MTKSQVDKLGERLKTGNYSDDDLRLLDEYRQSFADAYDAVVQKIAERTGIQPTGRRIKSTQSIIAKLQRQSTKLSQIQDVAGCRITVEDIHEQDRVVEKISSVFPKAAVVDRRERPSHGYRAVHIIVGSGVPGTRVEIQVRTYIQHLWAQISEKLSDSIDPMIKYGAGPELPCKILSKLSELAEIMESLEQRTGVAKKPEAAAAQKEHRLRVRKALADIFLVAGATFDKGNKEQ